MNSQVEASGLSQWRRDLLLMIAHGKPLDDNARRVFEWATELDPESSDAWNNLGRVELQAKHYERSLDLFERAARCNPNDPRPRINAALAYQRIGKLEHALNELCQVWIGGLEEIPELFIANVSVYEQMGLWSMMEQALNDGLAKFPSNDQLQFAKSLLDLKWGNFERGWELYESRKSRLELLDRIEGTPEWHGEDLEGKTILVIGEQGLGDQIMFARYLPILAARAFNVVFRTKPELARLLDGPWWTVTADSQLVDLKPDYWIGLASLPQRLELMKPPEKQECRIFPAPSRLPETGRLRVGLCWRGNPEHARDACRSTTWETFAPLLQLEGIDFYSLQYGDTESGLPNLNRECHDFADLAAMVSQLHLVITVDTSMAHLAGLVGRPTWILLSNPYCDWRWGMSDETTEWYRSAFLYRQTKRGDWAEMLSRVAEDLTWAVVHKDRNPPRKPELKPQGEITKFCRYGEMTFRAEDRWLGRALNVYGEWSESEVALFRDFIEPGQTVVEVGANIGAHTIALAHIVGPAGRVFAFEPVPDIFGMLRRNLDRTQLGGNVTRAMCALGNSHEQSAPFAFDPQNPGGSHVSLEAGCIPVGIWMLDDILFARGPQFMKIDVEGMELDVLLGARETIAQNRPILYVENDRPGSTEALMPFFNAMGYRAYQHHAPLFNPRNFADEDLNVFGHLVSMMLLAVPNELTLDAEVIERHSLQRVRFQ